MQTRRPGLLSKGGKPTQNFPPVHCRNTAPQYRNSNHFCDCLRFTPNPCSRNRANASRSRIARRSTTASRTSAWSAEAPSSSGMAGCCFDPISTTFPQLKQKLVGWDKERVRLQNATDNDHRVRSHNIHDDAGAKLGAVVRSYHRIFIAWQHVIEAGFVFYEIVDPGHVFQRPLHMGHQPRNFIALLRPCLQYLFDEGQHSILREVPIAKVGLVPVADFELPALHN